MPEDAVFPACHSGENFKKPVPVQWFGQFLTADSVKTALFPESEKLHFL
ncbi:Uncharacterized protein dnm_100490 [Desulfonema magnum]|uniref:Uncharacterized protein n=1 Tax=Desulfonema magnum TaxID=45655 RepID=A0A975BKC2_9BACT|nr:Uncharacterized protein dnm_029610 [Desulfonema magnum]QTA87020.1 Uncharacterized protein dnm_030470 [Desulfonema magnum]QTA92243.1 Uncharacterized protein dnm_083190 [Desulfonema magnum]QTA93940.1 Uncharacterized protein dnm_100490 [Desulfonema magnum]